MTEAIPEEVAPGELEEEASGPEPAPAGGPVLGVFSHPDDAEIAAGGSLARWASEGRAVHLLILTNGDRGSDDPADDRKELARVRFREQERAAGVLGLAGFTILPIHDGELENAAEVRAVIARTIRQLRPQVVVTCDPTAWFFGNRYFNHADHRTAGETALDAVFPGAGNPHFFSEQIDEGLEAWKVPEAWLAWSNEPNHFHDITGFLETKLAALAEHASQVKGDMLGSFQKWLPREAKEAGEKIGVEHAEGFRRLDLT